MSTSTNNVTKCVSDDVTGQEKPEIKKTRKIHLNIMQGLGI
jgi:hypothetical protein